MLCVCLWGAVFRYGPRIFVRSCEGVFKLGYEGGSVWKKKERKKERGSERERERKRDGRREGDR